jgi:UDP-N-acetylglucosamine 2-epimerase (non-hydrolysing)
VEPTSVLDGRGVHSAVLVAGARPNFIKIAPILRAMEAAGIDVTLVHTGQHYDSQMSDVFFQELGIRPPDVHLAVGSASYAVQVGRVMAGVEDLVRERPAEVMVVVGDVNSTVGAALPAAQAGMLVAHVEAGLRSRDWTMPEEINRVVTDRVADLLYAPSEDAVRNLLAEGTAPHRIELVGNVMVDSLFHALGEVAERDAAGALGFERDAYGLVTLHRPSLVDDPARLAAAVDALEEIARRLPLVWPVHPRTRSRLVSSTERLCLIEPVGYLDSVALQRDARLVITDSGGIQEETTVLGVPCLTLRDSTERPITIAEGTNRLVGGDPRLLAAAVDDELASRTPARRPDLWDGHAAARIVDHLSRVVPLRWPRPTSLVEG